MRREVGCQWNELGARSQAQAAKRYAEGSRRHTEGIRRLAERAGIWRGGAGDVAQGAPQRALCDVWRRKVRIRNQESGGRKYESGEGT